MKAACLLLLLAAPPGSVQDPLPSPGELRPRIMRIMRSWQAGILADEQQVTQSLVEIGRPVAPLLCELLATHPVDMPLASIGVAVGLLEGPTSLACVSVMLDHPTGAGRRAGVEAIATLDVAGGLPLLAVRLDDPDLSVADAAEEALLASELPRNSIVDALAERLGEQHARDRVGRALGRIGGERARALLVELSLSPHEDISLEGLIGLWFVAEPEDGGPVLEVLRSSSSVPVLKQACLVLGRIGHEEAVRALIDAMGSDDKGLAGNAHWALMRITGQGLKLDAALWDLWWERSGSKNTGSMR